MNRINYYLIIIFFVFVFASCDDTYHSSIPDYPVYLEINLATAPYTILKTSSLKYFTFKDGITVTDRIGYGGIFVCTGFDGTIYAFDMSCPVEASRSVLVYPPENKDNYIGQLTCEKCGSVFDIGYGVGNPSKGAAKEALKRYKVNLSGNMLYITR